jgi:hypothetical protein
METIISKKTKDLIQKNTSNLFKDATQKADIAEIRKYDDLQ